MLLIASVYVFATLCLAGCERTGESSDTAPSTGQGASATTLAEDIEAIAERDLGEPFYPDDEGIARTRCDEGRLSCTVTYQGQTHNTAIHSEQDRVVSSNYGILESMFDETAVDRVRLVAKYVSGGSLTQSCTRNQFDRLNEDATARTVARRCSIKMRGYLFR